MSVLLTAGIKLAVALILELLNRYEAAARLRQEGAAIQATASRQKAEAAEREARAAGDAAADQPDDPRDLRD